MVSRPGVFTGASCGAGSIADLLDWENGARSVPSRSAIRGKEKRVAVSLEDPTYLEHLLLELDQEGEVIVQSLHEPIHYRLKRGAGGKLQAWWFLDVVSPAVTFAVDDRDWSVPTRLSSESDREWCQRSARGFIQRVMSGDILYRHVDVPEIT